VSFLKGQQHLNDDGIEQPSYRPFLKMADESSKP
jgi:hypothetical protein